MMQFKFGLPKLDKIDGAVLQDYTRLTEFFFYKFPPFELIKKFKKP